MKKIVAMMVAGVAAFGLSGMASAIPMMRLSDGVTTVVVSDGGAWDSNVNPGVVTYSGAVGLNWTITVTTGMGMPNSGDPGSLDMDLNSVAQSLSAGTLAIDLWDDGYFAAGDAVTVYSAVGGTIERNAGNVSSFKTWMGAPGDPFDTGTLVNTLGPFGPGPFSGSVETPVIIPATGVGFTQQAIIHHAKKSTTSFDFEASGIPVPDSGMTLVLLGAALAGLSAVRRIVG